MADDEPITKIPASNLFLGKENKRSRAVPTGQTPGDIPIKTATGSHWWLFCFAGASAGGRITLPTRSACEKGAVTRPASIISMSEQLPNLETFLQAAELGS